MRMTTEWDYDKKDYVRVHDPKIERYVSICNGSYIFDFNYAYQRFQIGAKWMEMTAAGMRVYQNTIVIEDEDLEELVSVLQERLDVVNRRV